MSISRKFQRSKSKYTLSQKIISAVTAAGFIMQPIVGFAQAITKADDAFKNTIINKGNGVTDIWADRVVGNSAVNVFKDFQLDANNIANMYFNELNRKEADAANLVNFVNSRIDINGTVNAIQNSQIGGNLFFLSKEGMAVGKSGVINTGSLYVMTPTQDFMEDMQRVVSDADVNTAAENIAHITNITTDAASWQAIPLNSSGTITVLGKVNAVNEVRMRAAKIGVGKNVDDSAVDNVASGEIAAENAHIKTGIIEFSDIVNINYKDESGNDVAVNSGITNLNATPNGSGDIVLSAYVDASNDKNEIEKLPVIGGTTLGTTAESVENTFTEQEFAASVDIYGEVNATGKADISAAAINSNADFDETLNDYKANNNDVAQLATVKADVNIGGTVKAADDVNIKAEAVNRYVDNTGGFAKALSVGISSGTPLTGDVAYSVLDTEANVNVASGANVESENGSVDIDAKAETLAASAASTTGLKFKAAGGLTGANVPATAVVYTGVDNKANVTVEGNIEAGNDISIDADADMKVEADNKMSLKGKMANQFVVGVTVAGAENSASVDIKGSGNKVSAGNDLSVNAKADSDFTSNTSIKAPEASAITVAVNVTDFNSNANVNVDTDLTAGNNLNVEADNTIVSDNVNAETKLGSNKYISAATQVVTTNAEGKITEVKNFINGLKTKLGFEAGGSDDIKTQLQLSEILKAGATVTYSGQKHKSGVNIGKNGSLTAQNGMLGVNAKTLIEDAHIAATGTTYSYNDAYPAGATLNASVLVNNMDNSSSVVVADRDAASTEPALSGKTGVDVNASVRFEYNRIQNMIQDVEDAYNQIETATANLDGAIKTDFDNFLKDLKTQISNWESTFATADETLATSDSGVLSIGEAATAGYNILNALNNLNTMLDSTSGSEVADATKASIQGASDLLSSALAFIDPNSYGNFAASSASKGSSGNQSTVGGHIPSAINGAGTVIVNNVDTVSKVEIGSNTGIASYRDVNINAESFMKDVTLGGLNAMPITNSGGGTTASIGATVNYSDFNTDTVVAVNNGASITGGNINIAGSNVIDHVSVAGSAGVGPSGETQSGGIVLNGMLSFVNGSSDILTVVDDGASLTAKQNEYTETVKDEETGTDKETKKYTEGNISITGHNNSNIVNVAAGLNFGTGSGAVGVGLAYTDFAVKNIAGVADVAGQIKNLYSSKDDDGKVTVDNSKVAELDGELNNTYTASSDTKGNISAYGFNVDAATDGSIQSVSAAASANKNDDTGKESFFGKLKGKFSNVEHKVFNKLDEKTGQIFGSDSGKANEMFNKGSSSHGTGGGIKLVGSTSGKGGFMPSFSIAGSGSVSLNSLNNATEAVVDNVNITMQPTSNVNGDISVTARDTLYAGAYSGAAALQWKKGGSADNTSVGFSGAAGVNDIDNAVKATIKNSTISNAGKIDTMALSGGEQLALGLGLAVVKADGTSGVSGNAAVSVNLIDHDVEALLENNTVTNANDINVAAYARDIENTGGGTLSAGQQKVGVGATVAVAQLNNNINAGIKGDSYTNVGNVDVDAMNALKNITVGIAAGATVPSGGDGASAVVEGAGVYNEVHNTTNAFIEGNGSDDKVAITTVDGGIVDVVAQDVAIAENSIYEQALDGLADGKTEISERMGSDFDITGANELKGIETDDIKAQLNNKEAEGTGTQSNENSTEEVNLNKDSGSSIITVAGGLAATTGKGAGGAAVAITDIENNYTANVEYADITAEKLNAEAGSDSNIVTVSGGIAAASKGSGVGSVTWNDVENTANVNIVNSSVKAQQTAAKASNTAQIVSVAGQISGAGKAGVGATLSYIGLDNSTEANITSTTFDKRDKAETEGITVTADAENRSDSYNVAAGVSAAGTAAVSGNVAVTQTHGTSGAVIDSSTINNAKKVSAHALDDTDILSVIGTVSAAGTASVGAGVAYTEIGSTSTNEDDAQQTVAAIENTDITTAASASGSTVSAQATDSSKVINVAVGIGGAGTAAVQGASATSLVNKTTAANITDTNIDENTKNSKNAKNANVTIEAVNDTEITSSADVAAVAGTGAGVGAGVAVNRIKQNTQAALNGGTMNVNNLTVSADGTPRIENIGIGIGVAGEGAGVTGNVSVNMIKNNVTAHIGGGANIVADGSVGVVATSDEQIANYAGSASVAGIGAGVGASVSVNQIAGTTSATVGDEGENEAETSVTAKGNDSLTTDTNIDKTTINDDLIDNDTVNINSHIKRTEDGETRSGLIVDASSTRDLKSFLINAGVGGVGAGVTGTVNVNMINGSTEAAIINTEVNSSANKGNVFVNAGDYTNMSGFVGSAGVAGVGGGVGLGSDTNTVTRKVSATVQDAAVYAGDFEVDADSMQGVSSFVVSAGVGGVGAGASGVVTVTKLNNTTKAALLNSTVNANTVNVNAAHTGIVNAGNVGVGASGLGGGLGISVGVLKDDSETTVTVGTEDSTATDDKTTITASGDVNIAAENTATVNPTISATGVGAVAGVAGATSINNINSKVTTNINNAEINSTGGNISGTAKNNFNVDAYIGGNAAGAVGVGASVTVNTIDSTVQTNVNNSKFNAAKDVTLTAEEARDIYQLATNVALGGVAAGANIAVTTVGQAITDEDVIAKIDEANAMYANSEGNDINSMLKGADDALDTAGITDYTLTIGAETGGAGSAITVNITGSDIDAGDNFNAEAKESGSIGMTLGGASGGAVAANAGVGILNINRNVDVNISGGSINADKVDVGADISGSTKLNVYQGSAGVISGNVAYASISNNGNSDITLEGVNLTAKDINAIAKDTTTTNLNAIGVSAGGVALGALAAEAANNSDISITLTGNTVTSESEAGDEESGNINISTDKANTVAAEAIGVAGGAIGGTGMGATVSDNGSSVITLIGNTMQADKNIDVAAQTNSELTANISNDAAGVFGGGAVSIAEVNAGSANDRMATAVIIGNGNTFAAQNTNIGAASNITQSVDLDALSISGYGALSGNTATVNAYTDVGINVVKESAEENSNTYKGAADGESSDVNFNAENNVEQTSSVAGITASGLIASGTNIGETNSDLKTNVSLNGSSDNSKINSLTVNANSKADITNNVNGDGGSAIDASPYAAQSSNNVKSDTTVNMSGNWTVAGDMDVNALHENNIDIIADALKASVVGYSGVHSKNKVVNNTAVKLDNASVATGGSQDISARNTIDYDSSVTGSGYGVAQGAAVWAEDDITSDAKVNVNSSKLDAKGSIDINALTGDAAYNGIDKPAAAVNKEVTIKSAGVVAGTYAESTDTINFTNNINIGNGSSLKTTGTDIDNADITITAADRTNFNDIVTADTQGGVIGAAGTKLTNNITRTNNINVGGTVDSNYDANFDAGDSSVLNLTLKSNAYNKTAAPLATNPSISGVVTQNSAIDFASGSTIKSFRNINAAAGVGDTTVAKESKTWRWVDGGVTGTGSISSTSDGTISSSDAVANTSVTVDGTLEAGKNHELDITIDYAENGKDNLEEAINDYGETLATGSLKTFEDAVTDAENAYNSYLEETGLEDKINDLSELEDTYNNNSSVYRDLNNEYTILKEKLADAQTSLKQAEADLTQAEANKAAWITENCAKYNEEHLFDLSETDFEKRLADGDLDEYQAGYQKQVNNINNCTTIRDTAQTTVNTLTATTESKLAQRNQYDTSQISQDIDKLEAEIETITSSDEYTQKLSALQNAQNYYNAALAEGVSADKVNEAVFGNGEGHYIKVSVSDWLKEDPIENIGMADYAAALLTRYNEIADMMQDYTGTDVSDAYSAELSRIQIELQALGVGYFEDGTFIVADGASTVPTIELNDLAVSGGNVNITGGTLEGSGTITANGTPSVTVTNNTDFFLRVNDVTVESDGGSVLYNNASVSVGTDNKYNDLTVNANKADGDNATQITITNTAAKHTSDDDANIYTPDIGIYGTIYNPYGNITITNTNNSIYVAGEVTDEDGSITQQAGSIKGRTINLTAGGSITQGYSDEIRNVAGSPENAISDTVLEKIQAALIAKLGDQTENGQYYTAFETWQDLADFLVTVEIYDNGTKISKADAAKYAKALTGYVDSYTDGESTENAIVAAGAVYINAASINVNGTIQSGYDSYKLDIDSDKLINGETLAELITNYQEPAGEVTTDYSDYMTDEYLVTIGSTGAYYDKTTGQFVYGVQAWYNPDTNEIFTEDIEQAGGGRIYLTGAIANTNAKGGKLVVLDGGSNYDLDGTVTDTNDFTFKLGSINADTVEGMIEINDTNTGNRVVYTRDSITTYDANNNVISNGDNTTTTYNPEEGLYFNWSNGTSSRVITTYKHVSDSSWWGLDSDDWETMISQMDQADKDSMREDQIAIDGLMDSQSSMITDGEIDSDYEYIAVDGSSEKTDGKNIYQISFQREGKPKQGVADDGKTLLYLRKDDAGNDVITTTVTDRPYYLTNADGSYIYETEISDKVTTTKKKGLFGLWGKTVTTTWKETSGMITAYDFGVKADNSIGIEFTGNASGSTGTITSNGNVLLGGDIRMGEVDITSTAGNIGYLDDATVISDNASFSAATGIDVIQKNANNALHLYAVTNSGDINIQAIAANANNMVYIDNVSTGNGSVNITAEGDLLNGNTGTNGYAVKGDGITLQSYTGTIGAADSRLLIDGDVHYGVNEDTTHNATNAYANGGIYLSEATGNMYLGEINSENGDVVLEVKESGAGFVDAIVNNDVMSESDQDRIAAWKEMGLLADGTNDAQLNSRDNQLDSLEAAAGNGSFFIDADTDIAAAQEQGAKLVEAGEAFVTLMKGGAQEVQNAKEALNEAQGQLNEAIAALGDDATSKQNYKNALEAYNSAYDNYKKVGAEYEQQKANFIENSGFKDNVQAVEWLYNYEAIGNAEADNYGWTQQQLLYAVQDTVINPAAGSVSDVKTANVTGNNITFISDTGNLGVVDDQASSIDSGKLTKLFTGELEDKDGFLEKLASARAGDVTWGNENITIKRTTPVSVKLNSDVGTVTVKTSANKTPTADHIYLLAKDSVLNADEFAANDLRLSGQEGINVGKVTGNKIILEGGSGDIGYIDKNDVDKTLQAMQVTLTNNDTSYISANAAGNIMLQQAADSTGNFTLGSVAGTNVDITANGDIVSRTDDIGYINASDTIDLVSTGGGIGTDSEDLRIKNSGAVVNTDVQDAISIESVQDGTLILGTIEQTKGGVTVESEGTIMLGRGDDVATTEDESVTGSIDAKGDVTLHAEDDIIISGKLHVNAIDDDTASDNGTLQLHSNTGDIVQTTAGKGNNIVAANVGIAAVGGDVELDNPYNIIKNIDLQAVGGSLGLTVSNPAGFNVDMGGFTNKQGGDIKLINSDGSVNLTTEDIVDPAQKDPANINGSLIVTADRGDKATEANVNNYGILNATGNISFNAEDNVNNKGALDAGTDVNFDAGNDVSNESAVNAGAGVNFGAGNDVNNESSVNAGANVSFGAGNDVNNESTVSAGVDVGFDAGNDVNNENAVNAGTDVSFGAGNDVNNESTVNAGTDVSFGAGNDVNNVSTVNAGADVDFGAGYDVNNESTVNAGGDVGFGAGNDVNNENAVKAGTDVSFSAGNDIINNDIVDAGRNVNFNAAEDIYNNNTVNADETIEFTAVDGVINSDTVNGKDVIMQAIEQELENILAKDSVTLNGDRIHGQNITQNTEADGDLIINTDSNSGSGPIESLVIDKIDANDKSVFTELWAVEADITTVDDKMDFNDIMIEENAWLENSGTLATIYGNVPVKDDDANVHIYQSYPSMYVNFIDADTVETDGRLLSLDDYWYAYDQRFTAENHLRWQHGRYLDEDWKQAYGYGLSLHNRYGLIDYQEFTETNAGADEVAVEA